MHSWSELRQYLLLVSHGSLSSYLEVGAHGYTDDEDANGKTEPGEKRSLVGWPTVTKENVSCRDIRARRE